MEMAIPLFVAALMGFIIWLAQAFDVLPILAGIAALYFLYESLFRWRNGYWRPDRW